MKQLPAIAQTFILTGFSLSALSLFAVAPAQAAYFSGLGWLSNASSSSASGISADGSVVIGNSGGQAVRWTQKGGMVGLGFLPNNVFSSASSISADGSVIAGTSGNNYQEFNDQAYNGQAFRWTQETGMVGLGFLPDNVFSLAKNISADGAVVVGESSNNPPYSWDGNQAFRWTQATGMVGLGFLSSDAKSPNSTVSGVSADGSVVVGNSSNGVTIEAFRWTQNNGMVGLGFLTLDRPFPYSTAVDVSADGSVVVGESNIPFPHDSTFDTAAFRWTQEDGKVVLVTDDPGNYLLEASYVNAVSADGSVIIGSFPYTSYRGGRNVAFRWTNSTGMVSLGFLRPAPPFTTFSRSDATLLSADGSIVFGDSDSSLFRWTQSTGMVNLKSVLIASGANLNGWRLSSINAVSADGFTIVGNGINPLGQSEGWVANLSPEPIPEPLTILGSMAAIGFAAGFERKFNKNKSDEKDPEA